METRIEYSPKAMVRIRKGQGRSLKAGGAWIYDNEIESVNGAFENGDMVTVEDFDGYPLGTGFINTKSKLTVRMMSRRKDTVIDSDFLEMRVRSAWDYRKADRYLQLPRHIRGSRLSARYCHRQIFRCAGGGIPGPGNRPLEAGHCGQAQKGHGRGRSKHPGRIRAQRRQGPAAGGTGAP